MYDAIIIGSGYAGSVLAARLAPRAKVLLIERGKWWRPGDFPEGLTALARVYLSRRNPLGLWAMRIGEGTGNAFASAFGGSSAVNYGITSRPDPHAFDGWPVDEAALDPWFQKAYDELKPTLNPEAEYLGDKQFLDRVEPGARVDLVNTIDWGRCTQCGRCVPGCNLGAKLSLDFTYLKTAMEAGVELRLETTVDRFEPLAGGGYEVHVHRTGRPGEVATIPTRRLIVATGTLGTLDLMHAVRDRFPLGPAFGRFVSMNGDGMAFLYNIPDRLSSHAGAPISTSVRLRFDDEAGKRRTLIAMSGRVPKSIMKVAGTALALGAEALIDPDAGAELTTRGLIERVARRIWDLGPIGERGAFSHTFMYKLDGQDSSAGTARFVDDHAVIDWPDYLDDPINRFADRKLREWAEKAGGRVVPNVASLKFPGMRSFSVHPMGGCRMGDSADAGVVDTFGRVYNPSGGFYDGLRIVDGSIIHSSLGVPPSLTITALAERAAADLLEELPSA